MKTNCNQLLLLLIAITSLLCSCKDSNSTVQASPEAELNSLHPSEAISNLADFSITLGDGTTINDLKDYQKKHFFYTAKDGGRNWVVFKTPNSGITTKNSHNTRTELMQTADWLPKDGGKLNGELKVMHVSTSGDARVAASFSVVVGQIHSGEGHKNEPLKIFYKKFPGHKKGSVYWNYEINTEGDNSERWDFSTAVWGNDMSVIGTAPNDYPAEPEDGIELGEEFTYEINVFEGTMHLTFTSANHETKTFTKDLQQSEFSKGVELPKQIVELYSIIGREGKERPKAYSGELQFFKQGAYNQSNGRAPETNMVWSTGSDIYDGDLEKQYLNGSYTEVWFKVSSIGEGTAPEK